MFARWKQYRQFRKEVNKDVLRAQAIAWTKAYFKRQGIPHWTHEYQYTFAAHVTRYMESYLHAYAKRRIRETNQG